MSVCQSANCAIIIIIVIITVVVIITIVVITIVVITIVITVESGCKDPITTPHLFQ